MNSIVYHPNDQKQKDKEVRIQKQIEKKDSQALNKHSNTHNAQTKTKNSHNDSFMFQPEYIRGSTA